MPEQPELLRVQADQLLERYRLATALDIRAYLHPSRGPELGGVVESLIRIIASTIDTMKSLQGACDAELPEQELGDWGGPHEDSVACDDRVASGLADQRWQHVADLCFTGCSELRRGERLLRGSGRSHDDRLAACESARRKIRRAVLAVLDAIGRAEGRPCPCGTDHEMEVDTAIAVRRLYAKFRRSLLVIDPGDSKLVHKALRLAAVAIAVMVGSADFSEIRTDDRRLVLDLQARILAWARDGTPETVGARLYADLVTAADLLRNINLRQELAAHDMRMLERVRQVIAGAARDDEAVALLLPPLRALAGRSDAIDSLLDALGGMSSVELVAEVRIALGELGQRSSDAA